MVSLVEPLVKRGAFGKGLPLNFRPRKPSVMRYYVGIRRRSAPPCLAMPDFKKLIARLQKLYGAPELPPARGALELVLWENACYLPLRAGSHRGGTAQRGRAAGQTRAG